MLQLLDRGINFFNSGRYFDAHEIWEDLWREEQGSLRLFYQGLIQAAVGLHHLSRGNVSGGTSQLRKSLTKLDGFEPHIQGINVDRLRRDLQEILNRPNNWKPPAIEVKNDTKPDG